MTDARAAFAVLGAMPRPRVAASLALTALGYAILSGYDALGLAYTGRRLPLRRIALGSFVAYGLSQTLGLPAVTGSAVRLRFWRRWGLSTAEIVRAASFAGGTFVLGVVATTGVALLAAPAESLRSLALPLLAARGVGIACVALVALYATWAFIAGEPLRVRGVVIAPPRPAFVGAQLGVAALDWIVAGAVLYVLFPPGLAPAAFLGAFLLAQGAGLLSHVPGGLGVFEASMLVLVGGALPRDRVLAALVAFRAVYYLVPFAAASVVLASDELERRHAGRVAARALGAILPHLLAAATFAAGAILLFSGATPSERARLTLLRGVLPLGIVELSHLAGSAAGAGLIVLAWAIRRRLDAAWGVSVVLLGVGVAASLLKGLDWEEALALGGVLAVVVRSRHAFYRRAALTSEPFTRGWIVAVVTVMVASVWLGFTSYERVHYAPGLWLQFSTYGDAARFLRGTVAAAGVLFVFALARLLGHAPATPPAPTALEIDRAAAIARESRDTAANLLLLGDKSLLFSESGRGVLMYGVRGRSWVALGDPLGTDDERRELARTFRARADRRGAWPVFYQVTASTLALYVDLGLALHKLGEQAVVPLADFTLAGGSRKALRRVLREGERRELDVEIVPPQGVPALLPVLRPVSDAWLASKRAREKGFSVGRFDPTYLARFPVAVVRARGAVVAFANLWCAGANEELSVDLMRYRPGAPNGTMDYLLLRLMLWGRDRGFARFNLGMAPLSGLEPDQPAPLWHRAGALVYAHGERVYGFRGLRCYKEKFDPVWEPRYLASPGGLALPRILADVAALIAGGFQGIVSR